MNAPCQRASMRSRSARPSRTSLKVRAVATTAKKEAANSTSTTSKAAVTPEVAKDLYYDMMLGREFEEMCAQMYYRGKMFGFVHLYSGQEAVSSGNAVALNTLSHSGLHGHCYNTHMHCVFNNALHLSCMQLDAECFLRPVYV